MYSFLVVLLILISFLLVIIILMQSSKGGGLAGVFGGGQAGALFGVRRTTDFLTKMTVGLATAFMVLSIVVNLFFLPGRGGTSAESILQRDAPASVPPAQIPQLEPSSPAAQPQPQRDE